MSSRSSSSALRDPVLIGRVAGHRGRSGELTVRIFAGDATPWSRLERVLILEPEAVSARPLEVEDRRVYKDRLVLKLRGIDDPSAAAGLRGCQVLVPADVDPDLKEGTYLGARLVGMEVVEHGGPVLGHVTDLMPTGGVDLLVVERAVGCATGAQAELLIPMAREILVSVDEGRRRIDVRLPKGLLELNGTKEDANLDL